MKIMTLLDTLWDSVTEWFEGIGEGIVDFIKPLAQQIKSSGGEFLLATALQAVEAAEAAGGSGADKFEAAKATVVAALTAEGLPIVLNAVHGAIEAAVAKMKGV